MIFNQPAYFLFLIASVAVFRFLPPRLKPWWLFATGLVFYAYFSPAFVAVLVVEVVAVFALGRLASPKRPAGALWFAAGLASVLGLLVVYKYGGLIARTATSAGAGGLPTFEDLRLPLAISFFTFEFVHYLIDVRNDRMPEHSLADFLAFAMFVPTMVAGPIKRFQGFSAQVRDARADATDADSGIRRVIVGLLKKIVLADTVRLWTVPLTSAAALESATRLDIVVALLAYSFMIYLDFSAYSDIAIGSARLFGLKVPENFSWPYLKTNIADFWRSWHMSLTSWIRDYVYIPLGGNRRGTARQYANLVTAMAVSGIWHGAAWNFLGWGLYHGVLMALHRVWAKSRPVQAMKARLGQSTAASPVVRIGTGALKVTGAAASGLFTFSLVTVGWGLFAMPFSRFVDMVQKLIGGM